ncbi:PREDICTED: chymotrypsin-like elastase family member 1 [Branchiostoma belcheri]|uniref:Chymotrypsin-like elastase family member 1 n=1 Tax=Branchiostoma belcheri TaxID=7741 RepID=A0A6P4XI74_BRABE|nr:PREDICTED: chymotrypsin-like elastase family member 1 [Branchiostoma belcheri]
MQLFVVSLLCVGLVAGLPAPNTKVLPQSSSRIVGGIEATINQWSSIVTLNIVERNHHFCGGTLIAPNVVLSAAHCADALDANGYTPDQIVAKAGKHRLSTVEPTEQVLGIQGWLKHPNYDPNTIDYDVALFYLSNSAELNDDVTLMPLVPSGQEFAGDTQCFTAGWGDTQETADQDLLQQATMPIVAHSTCNGFLYWWNLITPRMLCAGHWDGSETSCNGDSGGPLACPMPNGGYMQAGIVSFGVNGCVGTFKPTVFAKVGNLRSWIDSNM